MQRQPTSRPSWTGSSAGAWTALLPIAQEWCGPGSTGFVRWVSRLRTRPRPRGLPPPAGAVVPAPQPLQRLGESVGALHEQAPGSEIHLAILVDLDHVDFVGELARIAHSTIGLRRGGGPAHLADALHGPAEFGFQLLLDLVHSFLPLYGRLPCFNHLIRLAELGCKPCAGPFEVKRRVETPNIRGSNGVVPGPNRAKWSPTVGKMSPGPPIFGDLWGPELWMGPPEGRGKDWAPGKRTPAPARLSAPRGSGCAASLSRRGHR